MTATQPQTFRKKGSEPSFLFLEFPEFQNSGIRFYCTTVGPGVACVRNSY